MPPGGPPDPWVWIRYFKDLYEAVRAENPELEALGTWAEQYGEALELLRVGGSPDPWVWIRYFKDFYEAVQAEDPELEALGTWARVYEKAVELLEG